MSGSFFQRGPDSLVTKWQIISSRIIGWGQMQMQITTGYEIPMPHQRLIIEKNRKMSKVLNRNSSHKAFKICRQNFSSLTNCKLVVNPVRALKSMRPHFFDTVFCESQIWEEVQMQHVVNHIQKNCFRVNIFLTQICSAISVLSCMWHSLQFCDLSWQRPL